jgi:hypothetical protein
MRMRHIVIFGLPGSTIFFHIITKRHDFRKKKLFNITVCFDFTCNSVRKNSHCKHKSARYNQKCTLVFTWSTCCYFPVLIKLEFFDKFSKNNQISNFMKIHPVVVELFQGTDTRSDIRNLIVTSINFAKAPKNRKHLTLKITRIFLITLGFTKCKLIYSDVCNYVFYFKNAITVPSSPRKLVTPVKGQIHNCPNI